ncbi:hypothetical protein MPER_10002, partial [Moniliophthora perniciosa FA553]
METPLKGAKTAFLCASWLNLTLYTLEICVGVYYLNISKYPWKSFNRFTLTASLFVDTACTAVVCYNVYLYLVDTKISQSIQPWTLPATILLTYTSSLIEQGFYAHRYWKISRNTFITSVIVVFIFTHVVFGFISGIWTAVRPEVEFSLRSQRQPTDLVIAICMVWKLRSIETTYAQTQSLIRRVSIQAVTSGIFASTATIIMLVLLFTSLNGFYVLFASLGRLYTLTVLINLIVLRGNKDETSRNTSRTRSTRTTITDDPVVMTPIAFHSFTIPTLDSEQ